LSSLSGISAISVSLDFLLRCYKFWRVILPCFFRLFVSILWFVYLSGWIFLSLKVREDTVYRNNEITNFKPNQRFKWN
jgi:hypothetical protein